MKTMKNFKRRAIALLLAVLMCLSMMNLTVFAEETDAAEETNEEVYVCGLEEHTHNDECYVNPEQPVEEPSAEPSEGENNVPGDENNVPEDENNVPEDENNVPEDENNVPEDENNVPEDENNVPEDENNVPEDENNVPEDENNVPEDETNTTEGEADPTDPMVTKPEEVFVEQNLAAAPVVDGEGTEDAEPEEGDRPTYCGKVEHTHTVECVGAFAELVQGMEEFGPKTMEFYGQFCENNPEYYDEETGGLTEDGMVALTEAVPAELAEDLNALIDLYKAIPERFAEDHAYTETVGTLANLAGLLGGDLDNGVQVLANETGLWCDGSYQNSQDFARADGSHTIYVSGEWNGTLTFGKGEVNIYAGTPQSHGAGSTGTINATGRGRSAITVYGTAHVILHDGVTVKGGSGMPQDGIKVPQVGYADNPKITLKNAYSNWSHTLGGGVFVGTGATFTMYGGTIGTSTSPTKGEGGNSAGAGGGIYVDSNCNDQNDHGTLNIYGGTIANNKATASATNAGVDGGGGGIWVNGVATIDPTHDGGSNIEIRDNVSVTTTDLGGGGIYVNNPGKLTLKNAIITGNHANGLGGGIASCVHGKIGIVNIGNNGAAIYDNTNGINGENGTPTGYAQDNNETSTSGHWTGTVGDFVDAHSKWQDGVEDSTATKTAKAAFRVAAKDIFSAGNATEGNSGTVISDTRPVDSSAGWTGYALDSATSESFRQITEANNGYIYGGFLLGLTAGNKTVPGFAGNKVTISGNTSATHGGGVATNGILTVSYTPSENPATIEQNVLDGVVPVDIAKTLNGADISKNQFTFVLKDSSGKEIDSGTTDNQGMLSLSYASGINQDTLTNGGKQTFTVTEKADSNTILNQQAYMVEVSANETSTETQTVAGVTVTIRHFTPTVNITKGKIVDGVWTKEETASEITFTNEWKTGSLKIDKTVSGNGTDWQPGEQFTFTVKLEDKSGKGIVFDKNGTYGGKKFTNGECEVTLTYEKQTETITGIPAGLTYTVTETVPEGWTLKENDKGTWNATIPGDGTANAKFTNERNVASLSVDKKVTWNADQSLAPENLANQTFTVKVRLSGSGKTDGGGENVTAYNGDGEYTFTLKPGDGNDVRGTAATITGIPTGTKYTVVETREGMAEGYTYKSGEVTKATELTGNTPVTIENHYFKTKTTEIEGYKDWGDVDKALWPEFITVQLWRTANDGKLEQVKFEDGQTDDEGNAYVYGTSGGSQWGYSFGELPMYKAEDDPYTYSVKETGICYSEGAAKKLADYLNTTPGEKTFSHIEQKGDMFVIYGTGTVTDIDTDTTQWQVLGAWLPTHATENGMVIENRWLPAEDVGDVDFEVKKVDEDGKTPLSGAEFTLYTNKECTEVGRQSDLTGEDGIAMFSNLKPGTYYLKETKAPVGHLLNNTVWTVTVGKKALKSVEEVLSKGDSDPESTESVPPATLEGWKNEWTWEPVSKADGSENGTAGTLTVPNARIKGDISITKAIANGDWVNKADFANKEFKFTITGPSYPNGQEVTVKGEGTEKLENLDYGKYTITEAETEVDKYTWKGVDFGNGQNSIEVMVAENDELYEVTATNTYTRDLGDLIIDKTVVNNTPLAADEVFKFEVTLTPVAGETLPETLKDSDGNKYNVVDGKFTVMISGIELNSEYKGNKSVTIKGIPTGTKYAVTEVDAGKWIVTSENGEGTIVSAGSKAEITNTYRPQVNTTRLSVKKVWKGDGDIERPASVTVQLYRNGQASTRNDAVQTLSASNNWSYTWTGLNENYSWSVDEVDVPEGYTREVTESGTRFTITNTYTEPEIPEDPTPLTSLLSVSKVWVGDAGENRPASVSVQFYKDGERAETVTLNDANGWSWSRVLSKEELASKWTVSEVEVPAGYTSVVTTGEDGISFTVTNTFTTTPETPDEPETPDIPDEETPKTDTPDEPVDVPDEQPPLAEIPDEQPPLVDWPPLAEIPEEQPPLVEVPEEIPLIPAEPEVVVPEEPVPMVGIPQTGDFSMVWYAVAILSALGLVVLALKKREDSKD